MQYKRFFSISDLDESLERLRRIYEELKSHNPKPPRTVNIKTWTVQPAMDMEDETYTILPELLTGRPSLGREDTASLDSLVEIIRSLTSVFLSCFALFTGLLNVVTFARMDLSQGVNQNLLLLSCFDVWVVATSISAYICSFLFKSGYYVIAGISMFRVWRIFLSMVNYPLNSSFVVTTVIALVRCLCVTMPLTFRDIVTPFRQLIIMAVGCCLSISVPLYVHLYSYFYKPQVIINSSHTAMVDPRIRNSLIFDLFRTSFYYTCFIVDSISIIILSIYLKRSSVFQAASSQAKPKSSGGKRLSAREAQVMKTVLLILAVFFFCNLPLMILSVCRQAIPGFDSSPQYSNQISLLNLFVGFGTFLNVGLNMPVYFLCNSRYRGLVQSMFCRSAPEGKKVP